MGTLRLPYVLLVLVSNSLGGQLRLFRPKDDPWWADYGQRPQPEVAVPPFCSHVWEEVQFQVKKKVQTYDVPTWAEEPLRSLMLRGYTILTLKCQLCGDVAQRELIGEYRGDGRAEAARLLSSIQEIRSQYETNVGADDPDPLPNVQ